METRVAQKIFHEHAAAVAYVEVETAQGDVSIGSAFHIGEGVFITARHCVQHVTVREVKITEPVAVASREYMPGLPDEQYEEWDAAVSEVLGRTPMYKHWVPALELESEPIFHENPDVDLAVFKVEGIHAAVPFIKLGIHWDDWVYRRLWNLSSAVVFGYPPIPMTYEPTLVSARGDIHTFVVPRHCGYVHFILSSTARGGFSGGPAVHEDGYALGLVTSSLVRDGMPAELGFQAVLSIEPIRSFLEKIGMLPNCQVDIANAAMGIRKPPQSRGAG